MGLLIKKRKQVPATISEDEDDVMFTQRDERYSSVLFTSELDFS